MNKDEWKKVRLARQDRLRRDKERLPSQTTRLVGIEIFSNSNFEHGGSFHSEKTMALSLGINVKSVKRALPQLAAAGYIEIEKRGRCNFYKIVLADIIGDIMSPIKRAKGDKIGSDRGHFRPAIGDTSGLLTLESNPEDNPVGGRGDGAVDARARDATELCSRISIGGKPDTQLSFEGPRVVQSWLDRGWDDQIILMGVKIGKRSLSGPPSTLRYFEQPIARLVDELLRRVPSVSPATKPPAVAPRQPSMFSARAAGRDASAGTAGARTQSPAPSRSRPPRSDPKRGKYEMELRRLLGADVFDDLPTETIEELCKRWPAGAVTMAEIETLKLQHAQARATGPPAAAATRR